MAQPNSKKGFRILRRFLICLLVLMLVFTLTVIIVPQYGIWKNEYEREQVAISWLEDVRLNNNSADEVRPTRPVDKPTAPVNPPDVGATEPSDAPTEPTVDDSDIPDVNPNDFSYSELYAAVQAYNEEIYRTGQSKLNDMFDYVEPVFDLSDWGVKDDIFGVVSIPKIDVVLPVYLGATYQHMADGFAQMSQTSIPIGGINTNCTLACHRGWNGMAYLRDVEMVELGDSVYVHNLWGDLEYRVVDIYVIEPNQTECLQIQDGRDLLTIFTCHPYRVSTHRYVLVCERYIPENVPDMEQGGPQTNPDIPVDTPDTSKPGKPVVPDIGLDIKEDIIDEVTRIDPDYIASVFKGIMTTVMDTTDGNTVESSQSMIFWTVYFPWMLLVLIVVCLILYAVYSIVCFVKKRKNKTYGAMFKLKTSGK